jgi:hypothetical protein
MYICMYIYMRTSLLFLVLCLCYSIVFQAWNFNNFFVLIYMFGSFSGVFKFACIWILDSFAA